MSEFHRMITYLHLYEHGTKRHNVGFAKIEKREQQCLVEIHMKNTGHNLSPIPVYFYAQNQQNFPGILLGTMGLSRGNGDFKTILKGETLSDSVSSLDDVKGIYIPLSEEIMFVSQWDETDFVRERFIDPAAKSSAPPSRQISENNRIPQQKSGADSRNSQETPAADSKNSQKPPASSPEPSLQESSSGSDKTSRQESPSDSPRINSEDSASSSRKNALQESNSEPTLKAAEAVPKLLEQNCTNPKISQITAQKQPQKQPSENWELKWNFILENYPVMTPFAGDETTVCVRLELKDLRLLPREYWYLGNNSFLLHGFFNYRYLILGMTEKNNRKKWFIGIPGVFQNPERVMASLFGFPEFRNEKSLPVNTGEFGYWYRYLDQ
ncbi:MAG: hypothetical protein HFH41_07880 [Lachnospiraceae bacterium]|nr:hypothetical protein [Lachnospiraceae bacterium]